MTVALCFALSALALATDPPPTLRPGTATAMVVDGSLDEEAWSTAEVATGFTQAQPVEDAPATQSTEVRVLLGRDALYVGAVLYDEDPSGIRTTLSRRDERDGDAFTVIVDAYGDGRSALEFGLTAAGVQFDAINQGGRPDASRDAVWSSAVRLTPDGWVAEFGIPYSQLRLTGDETTWGINFARQIERLDELSLWVPLASERQNSLLEDLARLLDVSVVEPRRILQVQPYTLAGGSRAESETEPGVPDYAPEGNVGADLKLGLSSNMILDVTVNPDFGQVEADPAELNLGTFETIFGERRPFFTEGTQIFDLNVGGRDGALLYTRRIGGASPVIGAAKLTGRTAGGLSFGALGSATGSRFETSRGYLATRVKQELPGQSYVGGGLTGFTAGADDVHALAGAGDWGIRTLAGTWIFEGSLAGSARSADGDRSAGGALYVGFDRVEGFVLPGFGLRAYTAGFQINDVGRFRQTDILQIRGGTRVSWNQNRPVGPFRRLSSGGFVTQTLTLSDRVNEGLSVFTFNRAETNGFQELDLNLSARTGGVDVLETRGLGPVRRLSGVSGRVGFESDSRRRFRWEARLGGSLDEAGGTEVSGGLGAEWTATDQLTVEVEAGLNREVGARAWAANESFVVTDGRVRVGAVAGVPATFTEADLVDYAAPAGLLRGLTPSPDALQVPGVAYYAPLFGDRDTRSSDLTARGQFIVTPTLSVQLFAQLFAIRGRFRNFALLGGPDDLRPLDGFPKRRDFATASIRSNAVLRWEYRPGSTLFVVWTQGRSDGLFEDGPIADLGPSPFDAGGQLADTFAAFPDDVVLVKLNYLFMR